MHSIPTSKMQLISQRNKLLFMLKGTSIRLEKVLSFRTDTSDLGDELLVNE